MLHIFYPDEYADSAYIIDYKSLYQQGIRGLLFDVDNTLVEHGADATEKAITFIRNLEDMGFKVCLISNNKEERVKRFNEKINVNYIHKAQKPLMKNYVKAMKIMKTKPSNTVFVGDQLFTDVYGAKRAGIKSYLVKPIDPKEEIQIVLKRYLERIVLYYYQRDKSYHHGKQRKNKKK